MLYKIKNTLIPVPESHRQPLLATLTMYDRGEDLANSPLIRSRVNLTHMDVYFAEDKESALQQRQKALIALYERIKSSGYNGSPILAWFDDDGFIQLYDGYHRLAIMEHLGLSTEVNVEVNWQGIDHSVGRDFPLVEVLKKEYPVGERLYQPVGDKRLKGWKLARNNAKQRLDYILKNLTGSTVLDIGCSEGYFSRELAKQGYKVTAVDRSHNLVAAARYLSILEGVKVDYYVGDWKDILLRNGSFDNILFLSVIHNEMKKIGVEAGLEKLKAFRGKANRLFLEVPNAPKEHQWMRDGFPKFDFSKELPRLEQLMEMKAQGKHDGVRSIYLFGDGKVSLPWWSLESWLIPQRSHYKPLFETLRAMPCRNIMEVGVFDGVSAVVMIKEAAKKVPEDEIRFYGFDLFEEMTPGLQNEEFSFRGKLPPKMEEVKALIEGNTKAKVTLVKGNTRKTLRGAVKTLPKMNLIYIDGGHTIETTRNDWKYSSGLMHGNTIVYFDDYCDEMPFIGARFIVDELGPKYSAQVMSPGDYYRKTFGRFKSQLLRVQLRKTKEPEQSRKLPWWNLESWLAPAGRRTHCKPIFDTVTSKPCRNIMEIGVNRGLTAFVAIKEAAKKVPEEEIHYYGFDLFEDIKEDNITIEGLANSSKAPLSMQEVQDWLEKYSKAKITLFKGNTRKTLKEAVKTLPKMDLIHIDGGHSIDTMRNDWKYSSKLMQKDTVVYVDGCNDEMPFHGSWFLLNELPPRYSAEVMPEVDYYSTKYGRAKNRLLKIQFKAAKKTISKTSHFRFHLLGLPHSKTTKDWVMCPFTQLTYKMAQMLTDMGHEVYHYGTEGSNPPCTEQIDVLTEEVQKQAYGDWDVTKQLWIHHGGDLAYTTFRKKAIQEILLRKEPKDILLISIGNWQKEIADAVGLLAVEPYVGHLGPFTNHKVFPSYAWMNHMYGMMTKSKKENFAMGQWYDAVIPHYFDPNDFWFSDKKEDYFCYVGRFISRKGVHVASQVTEKLGVKLKAAGQLVHPDEKEKCLRDLGMDKPHVEYLGTVNREQRNELMAHAKATFVPSLYVEPFGQVVVESLMCGTPVITTDWGSFSELVPQGDVGYRCRTMDDFLWASNNIDKIDPKRCKEYAVANYSIERVSKMYQEYFNKVYDLFSGGWYEPHPERTELDWLRRY